MEENRVIIETTQGTVTLELFPKIAPKTCENFVGLVKKGYYDGIIFHRVIEGFMVQGGDPTGTGMGGKSIWGGSFEDEFHPDATFSQPGILAMANSGPGTNGSQFFITTAETSWLNNRHTVFGKVVKGYDLVEKLSKLDVDASDRPLEEQKIIKATVEQAASV